MDGSPVRLTKFLKNPLAFGLMSGVGVIVVIVLAAAAGEGSIQGGVSLYLSNGIFALLVPVSVAIQMGLFRYHRNATKGMAISRLEKIGASGSVIPSAVMAACCVCCVYTISGILPAIGFILAASSFLASYNEAILVAGLLANAIMSFILLYAILHNRRDERPGVYSQLVQYK